MPLYQITPQQLPQVWPIAAPLLQKAIDLDPESITIEQVEYFIRTGHTHLLVWEEPEVGITGAITIEFIDYPRYRVAHGNLLGGKAFARKHIFEEVCNWMRLHGATQAQGWAQGSIVQMYEKLGMTNTHQVMRIKL
jgi:hypothetical protein